MENIKISRDTEGVRIELLDLDDADGLAKLGPFSLIIDDDQFYCAPDSTGINVCFFENGCGGIGLRFYAGFKRGVRPGRFGPLKLYVDLHNPLGFSAHLPPMYLRAWPTLRLNVSYDVPPQLILTLSERIFSRMVHTNTTMQDAMRLESRRIPKPLRRYLPHPSQGERLVREQIANLTLHSEEL